MSIARSSVNSPVFVSMVALMVLLVGAIALVRLPVDLMPDISYPTITVSVVYENAAPQEMEELVARPLEEALSAVPGVEEITSTSGEGVTRVRVSLTWGTDLDVAANDIRDRLDRVAARLPEDAERPLLRKFDAAAFPIMILGASADLDPVEMKDLLDREVKYRLERAPGVASADIFGAYDREIHINLDPAKVKALGLPLNTVLERVTSGNRIVPAGSVRQSAYEVTVRTQGEYADLDQIRETVLAQRDGAYIRVKDVGVVQDRWQRMTRAVRVDGKPGVRLAISKQSGANTVAVADAVRKEIEALSRDVPQVKLATIIDTSTYIRRSIINVGNSAWQGGLLAVVILLIFLRNLKGTAIISVVIPLSIVATFALLYFRNFTLNIMTLGGLALGVGMLVDNAIVVIENIRRLEEGGMDRRTAAMEGTHEVLAAIVASTLTTVAVFFPMVFIRGMSGVMFQQLAWVISFSLMCSLLAAMTVVPMLSARAPLGGGEGHRAWRAVSDRVGRALGGLENGYQSLLHWALDHRWAVVIAAALLLAGSLMLKPFIGVELMPVADEGEVRISIEMETGSRLEVVDAAVRRVEEIVRQSVPEVESVVASAGGGASPWQVAGNHLGDVRLALVPQSQRKRSSQQIADALRPLLKGIPGATIRARAGQGLFILRMGSSAGDQIQVEVRGHDFEAADRLAAQVRARMDRVAGITDTRLSREPGGPEHRVHVDRRRAADLELTVSDVANALQTALSGTIAGYYRVDGKEFPIRVQFDRNEEMTLEEVLALTVQNRRNQAVPLNAVVDTRPARSPITIERKDQERIIQITANFTGRDMGSVIEDIRAAIHDVPVPRDFTVTFAGDYEEQQKAFRELLLSIILALVLVYMVMACQYESLRDPLVVMFSVPLAAIGVMLILFLTNTTFNIQSYIGCIMLGGIVVNNAILLVDHTNLLRRRDGMAVRAAIEEAGRRRLRPILMTTLTTALALLPLALGLGEGGEAQAPMARVVLGGLSVSGLITLVVIPVVYSLFERSEHDRREREAAAN